MLSTYPAESNRISSDKQDYSPPLLYYVRQCRAG